MILLLIHFAATASMTGLIWFVQVVHYPLFEAVHPDRFVDYESRHMQLTTRVVAPLMLLELTTTILILFRDPTSLAWMGLALLAVIWISTAALQVPCHHRLSAGFCPLAARRLVRTNWLRTIAWTARSLLAAAMIMTHAG